MSIIGADYYNFDFTARHLDHGGFAVTMLILFATTPTKVMVKFDLLTQKSFGRRIAMSAISSFSGFAAIIAFYFASLSLGYEFQAPEYEGITSEYAVNVVWFFLMVIIIERCLKLTEAMFIKSEAR